MKKSEEYPSCMNNIIEDIQGGGNPTHMARFALVSFLADAGVSAKACKELFTTVHDYNQHVTSFQVDQIFDRDYSAPVCEKLASCDLCPVALGDVDDSLCEKDWLNHPNKYTRIKTGD